MENADLEMIAALAVEAAPERRQEIIDAHDRLWSSIRRADSDRELVAAALVVLQLASRVAGESDGALAIEAATTLLRGVRTEQRSEKPAP